MKANLLILLLLSICTSCISLYHKDKLEVHRLNTGQPSALKLNGYYYKQESDSCFRPMLLFADGYMYEDSRYCISPDSFEKELAKGRDFYPHHKAWDIWGWGIWWASQDSIYIQQYVNRAGEYDLRFRRGKLLAQSTFVLTYDSISYHTPPVRYEANTYLFRSSPAKPDSINYISKHLSRFGKR